MQLTGGRILLGLYAVICIQRAQKYRIYVPQCACLSYPLFTFLISMQRSEIHELPLFFPVSVVLHFYPHFLFLC